ncbi:Krev interaction trapped protein [Trichinella spiralis]|uniref:Krev interaction trapped protein n=1 Tax=Trichinella spiralis TaxID=6334 RepID=A0ABR3KA47_TRISP
MDPSVWSTTGGLFTVPRVSENNSLYSSIRSCTEDSATLCTPTSRMSNGLNHFFPSRLRRGPLTTTTGSDPLNELNLTEREVAPNISTTHLLKSLSNEWKGFK